MVIDPNLELSLAVGEETHVEFKGLTGGQTMVTCSGSTPAPLRQGLPVAQSTLLQKVGGAASVAISIPDNIMLGMVGK